MYAKKWKSLKKNCDELQYMCRMVGYMVSKLFDFSATAFFSCHDLNFENLHEKPHQ